MKRSPFFQKIVDRMAAGIYCRDGFLGSDTRPLEDILDTDRSAVESLGVVHERLAERLRNVLDAAMAAQGSRVDIGESLTAVYSEAMGRIPCPWGDGVFPKGEVALTDSRTGENIRFTPLSVHLVGRHGFYQGRGCRYRLEPAVLCRIFRLGK